MLSEVQYSLDEACGLARAEALLLGVSGGADSLCLLDILARLGYRVHVAHFDHRLRPESGADAGAVREAARRYGLPFHLGAADVDAYSRAQKLSVEEAARNLRYRFLFEQASQVGARAVATGHSADDQVETVLMHLLRGSGLAGLQGMPYRALPNPWSKQIALVRPLLDIWRWQIEAYNLENDLHPVLDASNLQPRFYRNRLRLEVIPGLEQMNPGLRQRIWQMAQVIRQEAELLDQAVAAGWQTCWLGSGDGWVAFSLPALRGQPAALQRRLLQQAILQLRPGLRDLDYAALERGRRFIAAPPRSQRSDLLARLRLQIEGDRLYLAGWQASWPGAGEQAWPQLAGSEILPILPPAEIRLPGGWTLHARISTGIAGVLANIQAHPDPYQAWIDAASLAGPLELRSRLPGERFQPLGMGGHSLKLSDFMINAKIPAALRAGWPVVACNAQVVWLAGLRLAHPFRLTATSQAAVHLRLEHSQAGNTDEPGNPAARARKDHPDSAENKA